MIRRVVRMADREWIRVGWVGSQTARHRLLACIPLILLGLSALAIESIDYDGAGLLILTGVVLSVCATLAFEWRRMAALGNARRSERVFRASKRT
ncbi:hypothetical protein QLH51_03000 [Sphingomonas sp. 2R-10]|uniref:hypothetical protein n=1 Tax=Sphingomonas sp. 2R-10 TaxID=3045148 RepID=UPI000F7A3C61|nr:hypothetical protein [Sphingomonas sp. 2R-10]MDJ0275773.1 hypothetical protein [Sphingomonas sp. 2R-10]